MVHIVVNSINFVHSVKICAHPDGGPRSSFPSLINFYDLYSAKDSIFCHESHFSLAATAAQVVTPSLRLFV